MDLKIFLVVFSALGFMQHVECANPASFFLSLFSPIPVPFSSNVLEMGYRQLAYGDHRGAAYDEVVNVSRKIYDDYKEWTAVRKTINRFNPDKTPDDQTCMDGILMVMPENVASAVRKKVNDMKKDVRPSDSNMDPYWSLRDELFQRAMEESDAMVQLDLQHLQQSVGLGLSRAFLSLREQTALDIMQVLRSDIEESVGNLKKLVTKHEPHMLLVRLLNYTYLGIPESVIECTAKLIFKAPPICITDFKSQFRNLTAELEKLDNAIHFEIPNKFKDIPKISRDDTFQEAMSNFNNLMRVSSSNLAFQKFHTIATIMRVPGFLSTLIADELNKKGSLCNV